MSVIQLPAGSDNEKERQPLVAVPAAGSRQVTVSLIIATLNEAENLAHVLPVLPDMVDELVIVDGGSTDGTLDVIRRLRPNAKVIEEPWRGKGIALQVGFAPYSRDLTLQQWRGLESGPVRYLRSRHHARKQPNR